MASELNADRNSRLKELIQDLFQKLEEVNVFNVKENRDALCHDFPGIITRSDTPVTDLLNIVRFAANNDRTSLNNLRISALNYIPFSSRQRKGIVDAFDAIDNWYEQLETSQELSASENEIDIPFTNREDELKDILQYRSQAHHILDGPPGYGKTRMLLKLQGILKHEYRCAYVSVKKDDEAASVIMALCAKLKLDRGSVIGIDGDIRKISVRFGQELLKIHFPESADAPTCKGVVILIDNIGREFPRVTKEILEIVIPEIGGTLRTNSHLNKSNAFRVILAGRYLAHFVKSLIPTLPWELHPTSLKPFDYKVVWDTARNVERLDKREMLEQLSAHVLYMTGGHPDCLAKVLMFCVNNPAEPETFAEMYSERIWKEIVSEQVRDIRDSIPVKLRDVCDRLSIFRVFNTEIIKKLMKSKAIKYEKDEYGLQEDLGQTFLFDTSQERYIGDAIVRRMLVLHLVHEESVSGPSFTSFCEEAYTMCKSLLERGNGVQDRNMWAIEGLYQALQKNIFFINNSEKRSEFRNEFFELTLSDILESFILGSKRHKNQALAIDSRKVSQELKSLIHSMNEDWDFRFTVNYFLRENFYDEKPFTKLLDLVGSWKVNEDKYVKPKS